MIKALLVLILGYLAGCFQTAYIVGKVKKHIDIRQYGSGNAGTTNALRVMGFKLGLLTFLGDFLKGFLIVFLVLQFGYSMLLAIIAGFGVIVGHDFPAFLNFKGGKGIASTLGIAFAIDYRIGIISVILMTIIVLITRYVSVASITLCIVMPICFNLLLKPDIKELLILTTISLLGIFQHRENIRRLLKGNENKLSFSAKSKK